MTQGIRLIGFSGFSSRVINAGKSTHNEDQASCEVLTVKMKAGAVSSTPNRNSAKRRSSLPNGEGLQLKENSVSASFAPAAHSGPAVECPGWKREKPRPHCSWGARSGLRASHSQRR